MKTYFKNIIDLFGCCQVLVGAQGSLVVTCCDCKTSCCCVSHLVVSDSLWPHDCAPPDSSVHRILQARMLEWVAIPFSPGDLPNAGIKPGSPAFQVDSLPSEPPGKLMRHLVYLQFTISVYCSLNRRKFGRPDMNICFSQKQKLKIICCSYRLTVKYSVLKSSL